MDNRTKLNKVVIWGHKLHSHTHSYIHNAYKIAFEHLGYNTMWYDENDNITNIDFSNTLFITEHQVDNNIPKRLDCLYIVHNIDLWNYTSLTLDNIIDLRLAYPNAERDVKTKLTESYFSFTPEQHSFYAKKGYLSFYTLWGTDLLPFEIEENIQSIDTIIEKRSNVFHFVGSLNHLWNHIFDIMSNEFKLKINHYGGVWYNKKPLSTKENMQIMQESAIAPAFQSDEQLNNQYVPCRIFKNISYGRMGITNNAIVQKLFDNKLIYSHDIRKCIQEGIIFESESTNYKKNKIVELMKIVKDNHTYVSRVQDIQKFINLHTKFYL